MDSTKNLFVFRLNLLSDIYLTMCENG